MIRIVQIYLLLSCHSVFSQNNYDSLRENVIVLSKNNHPLSITALDKAIEGKRVVYIGEAVHNEGF